MHSPGDELLKNAFHRGGYTEIDDHTRGIARRLVDGGLAVWWRTLLGREAIRLTEAGQARVKRIEGRNA